MDTKAFTDAIDLKFKNDVLHKIATMWFENQIFVSPEGDLAFSKTGLNKTRKLFVDVMNELDKTASKIEKQQGDLIGKAREAKKEKSTKDRLKAAGLHTVTANVPNPTGKIII